MKQVRPKRDEAVDVEHFYGDPPRMRVTAGHIRSPWSLPAPVCPSWLSNHPLTVIAFLLSSLTTE